MFLNEEEDPRKTHDTEEMDEEEEKKLPYRIRIRKGLKHDYD